MEVHALVPPTGLARASKRQLHDLRCMRAPCGGCGMTCAPAIEKAAAIYLDAADALEDLPTMRKPTCDAVIWRHEAPQERQNWGDRLDPSPPPNGGTVAHLGAARDATGQCRARADAPDRHERERLVVEVAALAHGVAEVMPPPQQRMRARLDPVTSNACKRTQFETLDARLIGAVRETGAPHEISTNGSEQMPALAAPTATPVVPHDALWPDDPPSGALRRPPPIAAPRETRLRHALDPLGLGVDGSDHLVHRLVF